MGAGKLLKPSVEVHVALQLEQDLNEPPAKAVADFS
jgi:hypothetical protein